MENTSKSVTKFLDDRNVYRSGEVVMIDRHDMYDLFVAYASACSAPSSIWEEEKKRIVQEVMEMHPYKVPGKPHTYCDYNQGWEDACDILDQHLTEWAISRLSERNFVHGHFDNYD